MATPGQPYKLCPGCGQQAVLNAPNCPRCGRPFSTQFVPPNQTQAFFPGDPNNPYPGMPYRRDGLADLLLGLPTWAVFVISFFVPILGILMIVGYYGYAPARDPERGKMAIFGVVAPFLLTTCIFGFLILMPLLLSTHR